MSKKAPITDPNFPPSSPDPVAELLDGLRKPIALDVKKTAAESAGLDAAEYRAPAHAPPARAEHETLPNARVIIEHTPVPARPEPVAPGILGITSEEQARLDAMFEAKLAKTKPPSEPRKSDPPPVQTEPPILPVRKLGILPVLAILAGVLAIGAVIVWLRHPRDVPIQTIEAASPPTLGPSATVIPKLTASTTPVSTPAPTRSAPPPPTVSPSSNRPPPNVTIPPDAGLEDDDPGAKFLKGH